MNNQILNHNLYSPNSGASPNKRDFQTVEWGRETNSSWIIGKSSNPVFFTADGHNVKLEDYARGSSVLIVHKSSIPDIPNHANAHIWGIDEVANHLNVNIWSVFNKPIDHELRPWLNPAILKLLPLQFARDVRQDRRLTSHSPNCFYYRRHSSFNAANFLLEETIWSDNSEFSEIVSVLKLAIVLGYRKIFISANLTDEISKAYKHLNQLIPILDENDIAVFACGKVGPLSTIDINKAVEHCIL